MKTITFFNNKGGVGKTSLVYHLAWMFSELGERTIAVDLDPQSNLTSAFLTEERLEELWPEEDRHLTILATLQQLLDRLGDIQPPHLERISDNLTLIAGDLGLSAFEDRLAEAWGRCLSDNQAESGDAFRVMSSFYRVMRSAADDADADYVLIDVGPNLGAMNRAALVSSDYVVVPLAADLFSLQGLRNLGPALRTWRNGWVKRMKEEVPKGLVLPRGTMKPIGYVLIPPSTRHSRPVKAYKRWADRIPTTYSQQILEKTPKKARSEADPNELATLKHYKSLMSLAQDARKPMFRLRPADGAIGGHMAAVNDCYRDFETLAQTILSACRSEDSEPTRISRRSK